MQVRCYWDGATRRNNDKIKCQYSESIRSCFYTYMRNDRSFARKRQKKKTVCIPLPSSIVQLTLSVSVFGCFRQHSVARTAWSYCCISLF